MSKHKFKWLWIILALLFLFEAWFWDYCQSLWHNSALYLHWKRFEPRFRAWLFQKPVWVSLTVFLIPVIVIEPFQIFALSLMANHRLFAGVMILVLAKFIGLGFFAIVFDLTRAKLLTSPLISKAYLVIMAWRLWAHELTKPYAELIRTYIERMKLRVKSNAKFSARLQRYKQILIRLKARLHSQKY